MPHFHPANVDHYRNCLECRTNYSTRRRRLGRQRVEERTVAALYDSDPDVVHCRKCVQYWHKIVASTRHAAILEDERLHRRMPEKMSVTSLVRVCMCSDSMSRHSVATEMDSISASPSGYGVKTLVPRNKVTDTRAILEEPTKEMCAVDGKRIRSSRASTGVVEVSTSSSFSKTRNSIACEAVSKFQPGNGIASLR
ncbi:hypothetical protein BV20DRAFT_671658 [Pilatotrama ljubarskyi]|nr:hypothetical protein BV20DRAFT_671658 [Pilatotrama ljubarskyi]